MYNYQKGFTSIQIIISIIAGVIFFGGIVGGVLYFSKSTNRQLNVQQQGKCGDGVCNAFEKANSNICPSDCEISQTQPQKIEEVLNQSDGQKNCQDLCGDGACQEVVCMAFGCPCAETAESCAKDCQQEQPVTNDNSFDADGFLWGTEMLTGKLNEATSAINNDLKTKYIKVRVAINGVSKDNVNFSQEYCFPSAQNCSKKINLDDVAKIFKQNGWSMMPMLSYGYPNIKTAFASTDVQKYADFVKWFVSRYKNDANIKYVELENCPNCRDSLQISNELLVEATNKAYDTIKSVYPDIMVGTPGFEYWVDEQNSKMVTMIEYFLDKNNEAKFDFWAFHGYQLSIKSSVASMESNPPTKSPSYNKYAGVKGVLEIRKKLNTNGWQNRLIIDTENGPYFTGTPSSYTESVQKNDAAALAQDSLLKRVQQVDGKTALAGKFPCKTFPRTDERPNWDGCLNSDGSATYAIKALAFLWSKLNTYNYSSHLSGEWDAESTPWVEKFTSGSNKELYIFFKPFKYVSGKSLSLDNETINYTLNLTKTPKSITLTDIDGKVSNVTASKTVTLQAVNAPKYLEVNY